MVEIPRDIIIDKEVVLEKIVEVPVVNKIIKQVPTEKIVDVYKEVIVDRIVEVPEQEIRPVEVVLNTTAGVVTVNERRANMELNTRIRKSHLNPRQVAEFEATSRQLADVTAENEAIKAQISALQQRLALSPPERVAAAQNEQANLAAEIARLRGLLANNTIERDQLRAENSQPQQVELTENVDIAPAEQLRRDIELVRAKNQQLRDFLATTRDAQARNAAARAEANRPHHAQQVVTAVSQGPIVAQTPVVTQVAAPVTTTVTQVAAPVTTAFATRVAAPVTTQVATAVAAPVTRVSTGVVGTTALAGGVTRVSAVGAPLVGGATRVSTVGTRVGAIGTTAIAGGVARVGAVGTTALAGGVTRVSAVGAPVATRVSTLGTRLSAAPAFGRASQVSAVYR